MTPAKRYSFTTAKFSTIGIFTSATEFGSIANQTHESLGKTKRSMLSSSGVLSRVSNLHGRCGNDRHHPPSHPIFERAVRQKRHRLPDVYLRHGEVRQR